MDTTFLQDIQEMKVLYQVHAILINFTLQICREMEENHDIDEEYNDYSDFEYDDEL